MFKARRKCSGATPAGPDMDLNEFRLLCLLRHDCLYVSLHSSLPFLTRLCLLSAVPHPTGIKSTQLPLVINLAGADHSVICFPHGPLCPASSGLSLCTGGPIGSANVCLCC